MNQKNINKKYIDKEQIKDILRRHKSEIKDLNEALKEQPDHNCGIYHKIIIGSDNMWRRTIVLVKSDTMSFDKVRKTGDCVRFPYQNYELIYKENSIGFDKDRIYRKVNDIILYDIPENLKNVPELWYELADIYIDDY